MWFVTEKALSGQYPLVISKPINIVFLIQFVKDHMKWNLKNLSRGLNLPNPGLN